MACAIGYDEKNEVFITGGGYDSRTSVTRYGENGFIKNMPTLRIGRNHHGCAGYYKGKQFVSVGLYILLSFLHDLCSLNSEGIAGGW